MFCCVLWHAGDVEVPLLVRFAAPENRALVLDPVRLSLTATGRDLPVSTLTPLVDFKYGVHDTAGTHSCMAY
jgi:hypothetical protein